MSLEKLLERDDIPEDAKHLIRTEIVKEEYYRNNREKSSELIKQGEEQFRLIFEKAPFGIEIYNAEGQLIDANQTCLDIFGVINVQEVEGFNLFGDPNLPPSEIEAMKQGKAGYLEFQFDFEKVKLNNLYQTSKSGIIYLQTFIQPCTPVNQCDPIGFFVYIQDITQRKHAELALKESEEQFRLLFEEAPIPIVEYDLTDIINYMDQLEILDPRDLEEFLERDPKNISNLAEKVELIGGNEAAFDFFQIENKGEWSLSAVGDPKFGHPFFQRILKAILLGKTSIEDEFIAHTVKERKKIVALCKASFFTDIQNRRNRAIASIIDITELKQAEEALRTERDLAQKYLDVTGVMMIALDMNQRVTLVNKKGCEILGYIEEEIIGKNWFDMFLPERVRKDTKEIYNTLIVGVVGPLEYVEGLILTKGNEERTIAWHNTVLKDEYGNIIGTLSSGEDITERKKMEQIRLELEQRRDNFVWMTSHELRTPLTVILGYIDFLQKNINKINRDQQNKILETIRSNTNRLEKLIDQVSLIAQFRSGTFKTKELELDFCTFYNEALEPYKNILGNQIKFKKCHEASSIIIEGDKDRLLQVIDNLLSNAIKQTQRDDRLIKVNLEILPRSIKLVIADNGAGIASENLERIFDQFVSIETEYSATGTGIGLYLSRRIVTAHGGTITASSKGLGQGSVFTVILPRSRVL